MVAHDQQRTIRPRRRSSVIHRLVRLVIRSAGEKHRTPQVPRVRQIVPRFVEPREGAGAELGEARREGAGGGAGVEPGEAVDAEEGRSARTTPGEGADAAGPGDVPVTARENE